MSSFSKQQEGLARKDGKKRRRAVGEDAAQKTIRASVTPFLPVTQEFPIYCTIVEPKRKLEKW